MAKIVIAGEAFDFDSRKQPVSEALAIEEVYGARYAQWQDDLAAGSAKAYCALAWVIWRRDGRHVDFADILSGTVDFDLGEMIRSVIDSGEEARAEAEAAGPDPTIPGSPDPDGTPGTPPGTSSSSRKSTGSARGRSGS